MRIDAIILRELHVPLVRPFETSFGVTRKRRILLVEIKSEGLTGWGECTAGERPFFSGESTDSAWAAITQELGPMLASEAPEHGGDCPRIFRQVRGNRMAKATLENAIWDLEAQREGVSLSHLIGGITVTSSANSRALNEFYVIPHQFWAILIKPFIRTLLCSFAGFLSCPLIHYVNKRYRDKYGNNPGYDTAPRKGRRK